MDTISILKRGDAGDFTQLSSDEIIVYWISSFSLAVEMDGMAGYFSGRNRFNLPAIATALHSVGADKMASHLMLVFEGVQSGIHDDHLICDLVYSDAEIGKLLDHVSNIFNDGYDEWRIKLDRFVADRKPVQ